jgi:hypothetical protein
MHTIAQIILECKISIDYAKRFIEHYNSMPDSELPEKNAENRTKVAFLA